MDIKILKDMFLTIERGNPLKRQDQTIYKRIMVDPGLLKSGKVEMENTIDRGNLMKILGIHCKKLTLIVKNIFSAGMRILQGTERLFTTERGNLCDVEVHVLTTSLQFPLEKLIHLFSETCFASSFQFLRGYLDTFQSSNYLLNLDSCT